MEGLRSKIEKATGFIRKKVDLKPDITIILGSGLGGLADQIEEKQVIDYSKIPFFPVSTVKGHGGELVLGKISNKKIVAMSGRFHYYEGYSLEQITFPIRVMRNLGARILIESSASGAMNPQFKKGDVVVITDQINFTGLNPLIGANDDELGPRFPDMSEPYDRKLIRLAEQVALEEKIALDKAVYIGVTGPNLETAAEYRFFRSIGADIIGMSTVLEVIVAIHAGFKVLGMSCVTDMCLPDELSPTSFEEILASARQAEPKLTKIVLKVIQRINEL
jgi:purine-nucleoside phosphorylase